MHMELNGDISLLIGCLQLGGYGLQGLHYLNATIELGNNRGRTPIICGQILICSSSRGVDHLDVPFQAAMIEVSPSSWPCSSQPALLSEHSPPRYDPSSGYDQGSGTIIIHGISLFAPAATKPFTMSA